MGRHRRSGATVQLYTRILLGMVLGIILGIALGPNSALLPADGLRRGSSPIVAEQGSDAPVPAAAGVDDVRIVSRTIGWASVEWTLTPRQALKLEQAGVPTDPSSTHTGWVALDPSDPRQVTYSRTGQAFVDYTYWIGRLFLALIKMVVVPLVFCSLVVGVASLGDVRRLGRMGMRRNSSGLFP